MACQKRENVESLELIQVYLNKLNQLLDQNKADDGGSVSAIQLQGRAVGEINRCQFHMSNCKLMSDRHLMVRSFRFTLFYGNIRLVLEKCALYF